MNTVAIICAISDKEAISVTDLVVNAGVALLPTYNQIRDMERTLEALEEMELVSMTRSVGVIQSVRLTELGAERAREAMEGVNSEIR